MDADMTTSFASSLPMVPGPDTFYQIPPNFDPSRSPTSISKSQFQVPLPLHRQDALASKKEQKSDRVMKGVIRLNFRPAVEIENGDRNLTSTPSVIPTSTSSPTNSSQPCKPFRKEDLSALEDTFTKDQRLTMSTVFVVDLTISDAISIPLKVVAKFNSLQVTEEEDRLANMSKYLEGWNGVISLREASLESAEEEFEKKKNELLAPRSWFEQIQDWPENTSNYAQDSSSYGSYERKPRSDSNGSLQPSRALDSGERSCRRRSSHSDRSVRPHEAPSRTRRSSSASHHHRHDSNQPAIRITPPGINTHSTPNDWGNLHEY
ncbi:hypothetical protein BCON_0500g00030 [Botryotinia convoluta]|uniref:Uncharacterized protein n=1 Tax=Botryotinia convoluta TaxID=54673 RepID=A0A4Z1H613_9HELO|nr:hypothetical protein BCON_0500g00030 [Botryotinia convoluta]